MKQPFVKPILVLLTSGLLLISVASCNHTSTSSRTRGRQVVKSGPPPYAPAHGQRARHYYRYYPNAYVYFDISKKVYYYSKKNKWTRTASLPRNLYVRLGDYVVIEMDSETPYTKFSQHKDKYPPHTPKRAKRKEVKNNWARKK